MGRDVGEAPATGVGDSPAAANRPRLFIQQMVLENFKSYAGKQFIGPFHKCFSAVVGPNGSGKSNVIDAMLFVFGKRAKQMRLNKVSELIHNSTNHQNLDKAAVSVHFQEIVDLEDDNYKVVPGSDFVLKRVAFRDNTSKYFIDNRASSFTEVTKILKTKGVDLEHNRFLILQGEVEQISLMKPKGQNANDEGFLEYLEDIIGSNQYVERIEEASKQLETLNEKRDGMVQRVKVAEKEKDSLESAKNEAETYMLKEAEVLKWRSVATELALEEASRDGQKLKEKVADLESTLAVERQKSASHLAEIKELEKTLNKKTKHHEAIEGELKSSLDQFQGYERQDLKYQEDVKHLKQRLKKLEEKIAKDTAKIQEVEKETEEATVVIPKMEAEIVKLTQKLGEEEKVLEEIQENCKGEILKFHEQLAAVRTELEPWEKHTIDCQGRIDVARSEIKLLKGKHDAGKKAYDAAQENMSVIKQTIKEKEQNLVQLAAKQEEFQTSSKNAHQEEQECVKLEDKLSTREQALLQKVGEMHTTMDSEKNQGTVVRAILQAKQSGKINGIYGRLGDLGAIDAKYDIAISTACGGLDFIVVETTNAAQQCVELLRTKGLGVATFLILEKQAGLVQKMRQPVQTPEGVPRLFDLVTVRDEKLRLAFYSQLGNTVVAKNLDQATRIAYGPSVEFRRVVSLEGAVFERSGTMSGGGGKPRGGRMGTAIQDSSVSQESLAAVEKELESVRHELVSIRHRISIAIQEYRTADNALSQLALDIPKMQMELEALKGQHSDLSQQLGALRNGAVPKQEELDQIQNLDKEIAEGESLLTDLNRKSKKLREKAKELQDKLENAGGERLKQQKILILKLEQNINQTSTDINRRKVLVTTSSKTLQKLQKSVEDATIDRDKGTKEKERLVAEFKEIESKAFVTQEKYTHLQETLDKHRAELDQTRKAHTELKQIINELRTTEVDMEYKLTDIKELARSGDARTEAYKRDVKDLRRKLHEQNEQIQKEGIDPALLEQAIAEPNVDIDLARAKSSLKLLEEQFKQLQPDLATIAEYRNKASQYAARIGELNEVTQTLDDLKRNHDHLCKQRLDEFMAGFNSISMKLKEMYQMITLGGDAELELVDSLDPFAEGVVFTVRPPKKSWKNIANLSGGEKTLSSLALVFALHHYKPTPLYVMDEIDAALDFKNVSIVGHYIKERTKDAQFVIISLRNNMFELADYLIGIYKTDNCTKSITIDPNSFAVPASNAKVSAKKTRQKRGSSAVVEGWS
ncbi:unnamed protein product [Sphagnum troendelagicum]|uniref:Structural maintenance of chromosomes protein n=1 Tax=Sphagnum troendelagicum TaxID=128251 RepID=A0ABP0UK06_9BRYO